MGTLSVAISMAISATISATKLFTYVSQEIVTKRLLMRLNLQENNRKTICPFWLSFFVL